MSDQQQASGGGELTQFESLSAVTPKKQPMAILIGTALTIVVLWVVNALAPTEAVGELKKKGSDKAAAAMTASDSAGGGSGGSGGSIDDI